MRRSLTGRCRAGTGALLMVAAGVLVVGMLGAGCGGGATSVLDDTTANLAKVRSGELRMAMTATAGAEGEGRPVGFEVTGPFSVASKVGELPLARLRHTRMAGKALEPTTFVSTGQRAFLEVDGKAYELPPDQVEALRAREAPEGGGAGLQRLDLAKWVVDPKVGDGGRLDGTPVQRVTGAVDVVKALNDIVAVADAVGTASDEGPRPVTPAGAERVKRAVRSSTVEVVTGRDDHLLRRLRLDVTFATGDLEGLEEALGPLAGTRLHFELDLSQLNRQVEVEAPTSARPLSELRDRQNPS